MKATSFIKSRRFLGMYVIYAVDKHHSCGHHYISPGIFSRLKEKGSFAKDVWGVIGSA